MAIWNLLLTYAGAFNAERVGRRPLWLTSTIGMLASYIVMTGLSVSKLFALLSTNPGSASLMNPGQLRHILQPLHRPRHRPHHVHLLRFLRHRLDPPPLFLRRRDPSLPHAAEGLIDSSLGTEPYAGIQSMGQPGRVGYHQMEVLHRLHRFNPRLPYYRLLLLSRDAPPVSGGGFSRL